MKKPWEEAERLTEVIYGKRSPGSGGGPYEKLDIIGTEEKGWEGYRIEVKYTEKDSYSLNKKTLIKLEQQALQMNAQGFMVLQLNTKRYIVIDENLFLRLALDA